jgi:hypothetical protein
LQNVQVRQSMVNFVLRSINPTYSDISFSKILSDNSYEVLCTLELTCQLRSSQSFVLALILIHVSACLFRMHIVRCDRRSQFLEPARRTCDTYGAGEYSAGGVQGEMPRWRCVRQRYGEMPIPKGVEQELKTTHCTSVS